MPTNKRLVGSIFEDRGAVNSATVVAVFPAQYEDVDALAALTWVASGQNPRAFRQLLSRMSKAADRMFVARPKAPSGGRPARKWDEDYGKSAWQLELGAVVRCAASRVRPAGSGEAITKAAARRQSLTAARLHAGRGRLSDATIALDADRLKHAVRLGKPRNSA